MAKKKRLPQNYMDIIFIPNPERDWKVREDGVVVIDVTNRGFFHWIAQKFFHRPRVSHIALDAYGTAVWQELDGERTVYEVISRMEEQFPKENDRMLDRVVTFLHTLQTNHYIVKKGIKTEMNEKGE